MSGARSPSINPADLQAMTPVSTLPTEPLSQAGSGAMVFTIISDIAPEQQRALWFQCLVAAVTAAPILAPITSKELVNTSAWLPLWLSLGLTLLGGSLIAIFTPETLRARSEKSFDDGDRQPSTKATLRSLLREPSIYLLPAAVVTIPLAGTQMEILTRFMSAHISWTFSNSYLLLALAGMVTLATLLLLLPGTSYLLRKNDSIRRDIGLLQGSAFFLVLGSLLFMMITSSGYVVAGVAMAALGSGTPTLSRALMVSFSPNPARAGSLFGVLAVGEVISLLACQLGMGALFDAGLDTWMGLPFGMGFVFALMIGVAIWMVKEPKVVKEIDFEGVVNSEATWTERYQLDLKI